MQPRIVTPYLVHPPRPLRRKNQQVVPNINVMLRPIVMLYLVVHPLVNRNQNVVRLPEHRQLLQQPQQRLQKQLVLPRDIRTAHPPIRPTIHPAETKQT